MWAALSQILRGMRQPDLLGESVKGVRVASSHVIYYSHSGTVVNRKPDMTVMLRVAACLWPLENCGELKVVYVGLALSERPKPSHRLCT